MACRKFTPYLLIILSLLLSCEEQAIIPELSTGRILIRLTDAPFPHNKVAEANVVISKLSLVLSESENTISESPGEYVIMDQAVETNLLELTNGITITLANSEVPEGYYQGIKLSLDRAGIVLRDETVFDLNIGNWSKPSADIVLPFKFHVKAGLTTDLLLDFDVARSFVARTNKDANMGIAGFLFNPYINVSDNAVSGSLTGIVTANFNNKISRLPGAQILIYSGSSIYTTTFTDVSGMYTVLGLQPGTYRVETRFEGYEPQFVEGIKISPGAYTRQSIRLKELH